MIQRITLFFVLSAFFGMVGCSDGGGGGRTSSEPTPTPPDPDTQLSQLAEQEHDVTFRGIATTPPLQKDAPTDLADTTLDRINTSTEMTTLREALTAAGVTAERLETAVAAAALHGSGRPGDANYEDWKEGRDFAVGAARNFLIQLEAAEQAQGVTVDRDRLDEITSIPSLAAMEDL